MSTILDALKKANSERTQGDWTVDPDEYTMGLYHVAEHVYDDGYNGDNNAHFIALMANNTPAIIALIEAAQDILNMLDEAEYSRRDIANLRRTLGELK
jgi:hypothetical protein